MKRSLVTALILGVLVSALLIAAHATHLLRPWEQGLTRVLSGAHPVTRVVSVKLQYPLVALISIGVAWLVLASWRPRRLALPLGILALELFAISWVCLLYQQHRFRGIALHPRGSQLQHNRGGLRHREQT